MNKSVIAVMMLSQGVVAATPAGIIDSYQAKAGVDFKAETGGNLWKQAGKQGRVCDDCHNADISRSGKHLRTGKEIAPLSPNANGKRFSDLKKVEKWFKRNCKWTWGRECTAEEKGHLMAWMLTQ